MTHRGPFQPLPFCDSLTVITAEPQCPVASGCNGQLRSAEPRRCCYTCLSRAGEQGEAPHPRRGTSGGPGQLQMNRVAWAPPAYAASAAGLGTSPARGGGRWKAWGAKAWGGKVRGGKAWGAKASLAARELAGSALGRMSREVSVCQTARTGGGGNESETENDEFLTAR